MKTQIIHLEPHDDLISIRDRMAWAKTPRILLVWPARGHVEVRPLDLTLLRRQAETLGAELGLVTHNGEIQAAARELGLSVFSSPADAQKKQWQEKQPARPTRRFQRMDLRKVRQGLPSNELFQLGVTPANRVAVFSVGVLAVLVVMLIFIPSADIGISPPEQPQSLTIAVSAEPDAQNVQISGIVPARKLMLVLDGNDSLPSSGRASQPDQTATGSATLMNLTDGVVNVPAGTVLLTNTTPAVSFIIDTAVDVPAGKGKTSDVTLHAASAGSAGNVDPGTITAFEGPLGLSLAVTNVKATGGGSDSTVFTPTAQDRETLKNRLLIMLDSQARGRFPGQLAAGDVIFPSTFERTRIIKEVFDPPAGIADAKSSLTLQVEYSISYAAGADLQKLAIQVLDASIPGGFVPKPGAVTLTQASPLFEGQGIVRWQLRAERTLQADIDSGQVISLALGKTTGRASSLLVENYHLTQAPGITIRPIWWPWLPFLPIRITVNG